ncbi:hypothetical protein GGX14DRAFT_389318 [Mycena pura]|uniref:Uncharacterized protein n=1 Tax=Mycena pura TaxID=153505 RepID=A0AAD6VX44_9AGAR|nr:hypothetical protein GGX14DRAFT_399494 [Mycena pura]KAJ7220936.1 hypothetical protein GGX14DRAFT_389318 [Mycena pura]
MEMRILQGSNVLRKAAWKQGGQRSIYFWGICTIPIPLISFGLQRENQDARALLGVPLSIKYILKRRPFMWTLDSKREKVAGGFTGLRAGNRWQHNVIDVGGSSEQEVASGKREVSAAHL